MSVDAITAPVDVLKPVTSDPTKGLSGKTKDQIKTAAQDFEASFVSVMLGQMFDGVGGGAFSGGESEQMFQSFMMDAFSKQITKAGGIGIAPHVQAEMLKLQGLKS